MDKGQFREALKELTEDHVHGASELARMALQYAADSALHGDCKDVESLKSLLASRAEELAGQRPSMAPLANLLNQWQQRIAVLDTDRLEDARWRAAEWAMELSQQSRNALHESAAHARALIGESKTIITHSLSSTVLEVFHQLKESGVRAIITESRPLYVGHRLAEKLSGWAIPTTMITDAQMGLFVRRADFALVGADSLLADGSVINYAGTYLLALAAHDQGVPFYVCCESFKSRSPDMGEPELEKMSAAELGAPDYEHVTGVNIYFDITPAWLVTGWITERGISPEA
jgi:translation initiation factor 2B subunit (eIF-2B alpha/beta/delta family)